MINWKKSVLIPSQTMDFLGFQINSVEMMLFLPEQKVRHIQEWCKSFLCREQVSVRDLAKIIGKMIATMQAILPATLQCRHLQMAHIQALIVGKSYETLVPLSNEARSDLRWWIDHLEANNGRAVITPSPDVIPMHKI